MDYLSAWNASASRPRMASYLRIRIGPVVVWRSRRVISTTGSAVSCAAGFPRRERYACHRNVCERALTAVWASLTSYRAISTLVQSPLGVVVVLC